MRAVIVSFVGLVVLVSMAMSQMIDIDAEVPYMPSDDQRPLEGLVITIDAGHGGSSSQPGYSGSARGINSRVVEGDLNMLVAAQLRHYLNRAGARVHMTRWDDRKVTLGDTERAEELGSRVDVAENTESHLFLAIHHNSTSRRTADGVVVLIWPTDSEGNEQPMEIAFADALHDEVEAVVHHSEEFPHYQIEHPLVMDSDIPSAVIEFGFLSNPEFDEWVSQQGRHRDEAQGVYNAVVKMWTEHRDELVALHDELFPQAEEQEGGNENIRWARPSTSRYARQFWPFDEPPRSAAEAQHIIDQFVYAIVSDRTFNLCDVQMEGGPGAWRLTGQVTHPMVYGGIERLMRSAGCEPLVNDIEMLPSTRLGEERYGVVQIPMALIYGEPAIGPQVQTQLLLGERVFLLDVSEDGDHLLLQAADGYIGWVRREAVRRMANAEFIEWQMAERATLTREVMIDDFRMPTGTQLPILDSSRRNTTLRLPMAVDATNGEETVEVPTSALRMPPAVSLGRQAAEVATQFLTTPYVFGARSALGIDCSGLSGVSYQAVGIRLPRDARQQVITGELVATQWHRGPLRPGDLVFFINETGRLTHQGVSLGGLRFIHASPPEVQVSSLDPNDPLYSPGWAEKFAFARRIVE